MLVSLIRPLLRRKRGPLSSLRLGERMLLKPRLMRKAVRLFLFVELFCRLSWALRCWLEQELSRYSCYYFDSCFPGHEPEGIVKFDRENVQACQPSSNPP